MLVELQTVGFLPPSVKKAFTPVKVEDYLFLVKVVALRFRNKNKKAERVEDTEAYSIACEKLVEASISFDPEVNKDFTRYAFRLMRNGIIDNIRRNKRQKRTAEFEPMSDKAWQEVPATESETDDSALPLDLLRVLLDHHADDTDQDRAEKVLLSDIYLLGKKVPVIAEQYDISRVTVYNRLRRILGRIRERHADLIESYGGVLNEYHEG